MQSLRFDKEEILIKLRAKQQSAQLELRKLKRADEPNKKKIYAQIDKVGAAHLVGARVLELARYVSHAFFN